MFVSSGGVDVVGKRAHCGVTIVSERITRERSEIKRATKDPRKVRRPISAAGRMGDRASIRCTARLIIAIGVKANLVLRNAKLEAACP